MAAAEDGGVFNFATDNNHDRSWEVSIYDGSHDRSWLARGRVLEIRVRRSSEAWILARCRGRKNARRRSPVKAAHVLRRIYDWGLPVPLCEHEIHDAHGGWPMTGTEIDAYLSTRAGTGPG